MGWESDPIIEDAPSGRTSYQADPEVSDDEQVSSGRAAPSMGDVARNAIPRGFANLLNTPVTLNHLIMKGLATLPGIGDNERVRALADRQPRNLPMEAMEGMGVVDPAKAPQTGPQRIVDTAIQSAIGALAGPGGTVGSAVRAAGVGAASGAAGQTTKELTGSDLLAVAVGAASPFAISGTGKKASTFIGTETKKGLLKEARKEGLVVDPASVRTSRPTEMLESIAGKAAVSQQSSINNAQKFNDLASRSVGLPKGTEMTPDVLDTLRQTVRKPYTDLSAISPQAQQTLEEIRRIRIEANDHWKYFNKTGHPDAGKAARALNQQETQLENQLEVMARQAGRPDLVPQMKASRRIIARSYDIERALIEGPGEVSAPALARMKQNGRPLEDELDLIARFHQAFPRSSRVASTVPPPSVSGTDATAAMAFSMGGAGILGPAGAAMGALPLLRKPARELVLSKMIQDHLTKEAPRTATKDSAIRALMTGKTIYDQNATPPR